MRFIAANSTPILGQQQHWLGLRHQIEEPLRKYIDYTTGRVKVQAGVYLPQGTGWPRKIEVIGTENGCSVSPLA
jgi:hypothetical protein